MVSLAEIPKLHKGFLMMEVLCSLLLLVTSSIIIAAYWNKIGSAYFDSKKKLEALHEMKIALDNLLINPLVASPRNETHDFLISTVTTPLIINSLDKKNYLKAEKVSVLISWKGQCEKKELQFQIIVPKI